MRRLRYYRYLRVVMGYPRRTAWKIARQQAATRGLRR